MDISRAELLALLRTEPHWVVATVGPDGRPASAVVGVAVADDLTLVFDTLATTRKCQNLRADSRVALTMWHGERTVQLEGLADEPTGDALTSLRDLYLATFPAGAERLAWPGLTHVRVHPTWVRWSDFSGAEPRVGEVLPPYG